ncbi:protein kinase domain-containing protein [Flavobacterium sp. UBA6031]|uniref:protein kinase domain-containing protein n=1 Tax=Flavobacterium sp. UBA6031 TaxID=1946551 RepID=UPI0025BFE5D6|nr:hypothetical protein [Flavobacterium sp. UBA6031]
MLLFTQNKRQFTIDDISIAAGGQGSIHKILSPVASTAMVAKLYLKPQTALSVEKRILHMCVNNPFINAQQMVRDAFAWPIDALYNKNGEFVGFTMSLIQNSQPLWSLTVPKGFTDASWTKFNISDSNSYNTRLRVLYNASQALDVLDKSGQYRVIDLKPVNMMLKNNGHITIIDTDSFQIFQGNNVLYFAEAATEEYCPPEFHNGKVNFTKQFINPSWDYFAFGVTAYQILFCIHPFNATHSKFQTQPELIQNGLFVHGSKKNNLQIIPPPHKNFNILLSSSLQSIFMRCFEDGHINPSLRPDFGEWRDALLTEIHRVNNLQITAGSNQPQPRPYVKKNLRQGNTQPVIVSMANINNFAVSPGGVNQAILSWNVSNATSVSINGIYVNQNGAMQVPAVNATHLIEAVDNHGVKTSQTIQMTIPVVINQFIHQIQNGYIQLLWDVQGANTVTLNQVSIPASGCSNISLNTGIHTITATSSNGYILSKDTQINCVSVIKYFNFNLLRTSAELYWEVWNAVNIELNTKQVSSIGIKQISLNQNNYNIEVTDKFGNTVSSNQLMNVQAQVRQFDITQGQYTAHLEWDIWYVEHAYLDNEIIPLKGKKIIPLLNKTYTLQLSDFNGISSNAVQQVTAPVYVPLMPVISINSCAQLNNISVNISNLIAMLNLPELISTKPSKLVNTITQLTKVDKIQQTPFVLNKSVSPLNQSIVPLQKPVAKITLSNNKKNRIYPLIRFLSKVAALFCMLLAMIYKIQ